MKKVFYFIFILSITLSGCSAPKSEFVIAFGSCNKQTVDNQLWKEIVKHNPDVWIWGGDNVYSDTEDMTKMKNDYDMVLKNEDYQTLQKSALVTGTWDDHDYGKNDAGAEYKMKKEAQQLFLDFMGVDKNDNRRNREGVYSSQEFKSSKGTIKVINLDTRYFRNPLYKSKEKGKRYQINTDSTATILGSAQWKWLTKELNHSKADFNIIVTSIQYLSSEHGFEKWANFPADQKKLKDVIINSKVKNPIILSGDRHISEFSIMEIDNWPYPLIDFTSSGLTHAYKGFTSEPNQYRKGEVIHEVSFGLLKFNFDNQQVTMEMRGKNNLLQQQYIQDYK